MENVSSRRGFLQAGGATVGLGAGLLNCSLANGATASYVGLMIRKSLDEKRIVAFDEMMVG